MSLRYFEGAKLASSYFRSRPSPPLGLLTNLMNFIKEKHPLPLGSALDVGCGSGQVTRAIAPYFPRVMGVDVSPAQIEAGRVADNPPNVEYQVLGPEGRYPGSSSSTSLVTCCMTAHWLDMKHFFAEVDRVLQPGGVIAIMGYQVPVPQWPGRTHLLQQILSDLHMKELNDHFGSSLRYEIYDQYTAEKYTMPYAECCREDDHTTELMLSVDDLLHYVTTMSGFNGYAHHHGHQAAAQLLDDVRERIMAALPDCHVTPETRIPLRFHYFTSLARKPL